MHRHKNPQKKPKTQVRKPDFFCLFLMLHFLQIMTQFNFHGCHPKMRADVVKLFLSLNIFCKLTARVMH